MDIKDIKTIELQKIIDFYYLIEDYGHIFLLEKELLDESFKKIIEGIEEVEKMINDSYSI